MVMFNIAPADIKTVTITVRKKQQKYKQARITIPPDLLIRHNIQDKDKIVLGYICKETENPKEPEQ